MTKTSSAKTRAAFRPRLEALEDRTLLSATLLDVNPGAGGSLMGALVPETFEESNGSIFFFANGGTAGAGLWKTNGTPGGTSLVTSLVLPNPTEGVLTDVNGTLYFAAEGGLWKSDGTPGGTSLVLGVVNPALGGLRNLTNVNGTLFFTVVESSQWSLWKSNGTAGGTEMVQAFGSGQPQALTALNGTLLFYAQDATHGRELWRSDGSISGTTMVKDINPGSSSSLPFFNPIVRFRDIPVQVGGHVFFAADGGPGNAGLWKSDGTESGTTRVKAFPLAPAAQGGSVEGLLPGRKNVNGTLFFFGPEDENGVDGLYTSDGTEGGTIRVTSVNANSITGDMGTAVAGGLFFFQGYTIDETGTHKEIWRSDGTAAGTFRLLETFGVNILPGMIAGVEDKVFFANSPDPDSGQELFQSDGTVAGTILTQDIKPGLPGSLPGSMMADSNGRLFFTADDGTHGREPWVLSVRQDVDLDGISAGVEDAGPNGGDGNGDGVADSEQVHVTSLPNSANADYVTLASPDGTALAEVAAIANPSPLDAPEGIVFPIGHLDFTVQGVTTGGATTVTLYLPDDTGVDTYYKYGPTPGNSTPHWYEFLHDGVTGAVIFAGPDADADPEVIVLHFVDGHRGDDDLTANGQIVDPGSPACLPDQVVTIDFRPGDPNTVNLKSQGVIPVAILSTPGFDASLVDVASILFAGARAVHSTLADVDNDGDLDLLLHFRLQDTFLRALYEQLLVEDMDADGVLDSNHQEASVSLTGQATDGTCFTGSDSLDLFLSGRALRDLLADLANRGLI